MNSLEEIASFEFNRIQFIFMNNNYFYIPLWSFILHWFFPLLLILTISLVYSLHFNTVTLYDDNGYTYLFQLKINLTLEVANYRTPIINHECFSYLREQLMNYWPSNIKDASREELIDSQIWSLRIQILELLNKVHQLEAAIKVIEPNLRSAIN